MVPNAGIVYSFPILFNNLWLDIFWLYNHIVVDERACYGVVVFFFFFFFFFLVVLGGGYCCGTIPDNLFNLSLVALVGYVL